MNDYNFKPFDKVLARYAEDNDWACDLYSHYVDNLKLHCCVGGLFSQAIPYEGNEELLGTADAPQPKRWRAESGETYWHINYRCECFEANDYRHSYDDDCYNIGNYFRTKTEAQAMAEKFKAMLKGE